MRAGGQRPANEWADVSPPNPIAGIGPGLSGGLSQPSISRSAERGFALAPRVVRRYMPA